MDLFWPGDERAGRLASSEALLTAMADVEAAWLEGLVLAGIAPAGAAVAASDLIGPAGLQADLEAISDGAEAGGNPVLPFVTRVRARLPEPARHWLHRGLTSQDVLDTALVLCLRDVAARLGSELDTQVAALVELIETHRPIVMAGRTLTQHAVPITFGVKAAQWLMAVLDATDTLAFAGPGLAAQFGGAAGTLAATTELAAQAGLPMPDRRALELTAGVSRRLGLASTTPWPTARGRLVRFGDAMVGASDAWGRIARDVTLLVRPEIGELSEPTGSTGPTGAVRGGSSTMAQKRNPVLGVLIRRAAIGAPALGATLHAAAADAVDERPDGAWHVEWPTLATLARRTVVAASQTSELLAGLEVHGARMRATADAAAADLLTEQHSMATLFEPVGEAEATVAGAGARPGNRSIGPAIEGYLGASDAIVDAVLERARLQLKNRDEGRAEPDGNARTTGVKE